MNTFIQGTGKVIDWLLHCCYGSLSSPSIGRVLDQARQPAVCRYAEVVMATDRK